MSNSAFHRALIALSHPVARSRLGAVAAGRIRDDGKFGCAILQARHNDK